MVPRNTAGRLLANMETVDVDMHFYRVRMTISELQKFGVVPSMVAHAGRCPGGERNPPVARHSLKRTASQSDLGRTKYHASLCQRILNWLPCARAK